MKIMLGNRIVNLGNFLFRNQNKVFLSLLLIETLLYFTVGHLLIESAYKAESISIFNNIFQGRAENSLEFYLKRGDMFYCAANILLYSFIYALLFFIKNFTDIQQFFMYLSIKKIPDLLLKIKSKEIISSLILFVIFYIIYIYLGLLLAHQHEKVDFFGGVLWKAGRYWTTLSATKPFYFKGSHPLFLLFVCPWGTLLNSLIKSPEITVIILDSFFGALAVFLSCIFFNNLTKNNTQALLLSTVFGLSLSQLIFSSVPETYALAGCSVITTHILFLTCLQQKKLYIGYWFLAGLFTFGVTITNFAQTLICFTIAVFVLIKNKNKLTLILEFIGSVVTIAFILSIFQKLIITHAAYFFVPDMLTTETKYIRSFLFNQPFMVIQELIKHFFLVNFVSPSPVNPIPVNSHYSIELSFFMRNLDYSIIGGMATIIWVFLLISGAGKNILSIPQNPLILALCGNLLFCIGFYSIFWVNQMFLYTCNFTFLVLALATNKSLLNQVYYHWALILLVIFMLINNLTIMKSIAIL